MISLVGDAVPVALAAAAAWGGGDFSGGMGVKAAGGTASGALRLVALAHAVSLVVLVVLMAALGDAVPCGAPMLWALGGGAVAGISLAAFYVALARGAMGVNAAISGLLAAAVPAVVSSFLEGMPGVLRICGFALALAAIWMIAAGPSPENAGGREGRGTLALAVVAGLGFGFYFVSLRMAESLGGLEPVALARAGSLGTCLLLLGGVIWSQRGELRGLERVDWRTVAGWAMGVALLDTGGNLLFLAAARTGRLDVAAVLASLYPASTILLAAWRLHERPTRRQVAGMALAVGAVVAIAL